MSDATNHDLDDLLNKARDLTEGRTNYANTARVAISGAEVYIDLYSLGPDPSEPNKQTADRVSRIILPIGLGKVLSQLLSSVTSDWENAHGVNLPLSTVAPMESKPKS